MEPKTKRSITDHFSIVPKEKKKEVKIHPLFTKRAKKIVLSTVPPPPPPPPPPSQKQERAKKVPATRKPARRSIRKTKAQKSLDPFDATLDTRAYFRQQKQARESKKLSRLEPFQPTHTSLDIQSIRKLMNKHFPRWQNYSCCKVLFDSLMFDANDKIPWCDKYRPNQVDGLLGDLQDFQYLKDWLETLKIRSEKKNLGVLEGEEDPYNLVLLVGHHGIGKTATVYTAAKETGYTVFEINASSRRSGKDVVKRVGEMLASHLVRFNHQQKKRKKGETIIMRDTVKRSKKIDIAMHFKRMLTMSTEKDVVMNEINPASDALVESDPITVEDLVMDEPKPTISTIDSFFKKPEQTTSAVDEVMDEVKPAGYTINSFFKKSAESKSVTAESSIVTSVTAETSSTIKKSSTLATESSNEMEIEQTNEKIGVKDEHKQSLVLLEEVDILFEEDKGFWPAVIELSQKSKRPIIMTCNDESHIPFDQLDIQTTIYFDTHKKASVLAYLQLICYSENKIVEPYDVEFLCELYDYDIRRVIHTLQFWLNDDNRYLFARIMGFVDLLMEKDGLATLMDRLNGSNTKTIELCINYFSSKQEKEEEIMGIETIHQMMENAAYADAWIGYTDKQQKHQMYDMNQHDNETNDDVFKEDCGAFYFTSLIQQRESYFPPLCKNVI